MTTCLFLRRMYFKVSATIRINRGGQFNPKWEWHRDIMWGGKRLCAVKPCLDNDVDCNDQNNGINKLTSAYLNWANIWATMI